MKVSTGQSQPFTAAAAFLIFYMVLGKPFYTGFDDDSPENDMFADVLLQVLISGDSYRGRQLNIQHMFTAWSSELPGICGIMSLVSEYFAFQAWHFGTVKPKTRRNGRVIQPESLQHELDLLIPRRQGSDSALDPKLLATSAHTAGARQQLVATWCEQSLGVMQEKWMCLEVVALCTSLHPGCGPDPCASQGKGQRLILSGRLKVQKLCEALRSSVRRASAGYCRRRTSRGCGCKPSTALWWSRAACSSPRRSRLARCLDILTTLVSFGSFR